MKNTNHLAKAKDYIAKGEGYYRKAADEIVAARAEGITVAAIARAVGKSEAWTHRLIAWTTTPQGPEDSPFGGEQENAARYERQAKTVLTDPKRLGTALATLDTSEIESVIQQGHKAVMKRVQAKQSERITEPTAGDLMGDERFEPSESWADADIISLLGRAHRLEAQVKKWGLVLGSLGSDEAFTMLSEAERIVADTRAALQERIADRVGA